MLFRNPYNYDPDIASFTSGLDCSNDVDRAQQHMKDECDINRLVNIYAKTGVPGADLPATNFDFDGVYDFQTAMNEVRAAQESFDKLPATLRKRFNYDPGQFLSFVYDENNRDEAIKLGLVTPPPPAEPQPKPVPQEPAPVKE